MTINNQYLLMVLAFLLLQLFAPGSLAKLIVKEDADLQLDELQDHAELVQDITLALQCRRQVKHHKNCKCSPLSLFVTMFTDCCSQMSEMSSVS